MAGIINRRHIEKWGQPYARFGWIDFIDDPEVCKALLAAVEGWARSQGLEAVHGPLGFTDMDREGMLVEGFDELGTLATFYNYPYYAAHMQAAGYTKDIDWVEFELRIPQKPDEKIARLADAVMRRYNLRLLNFKNKKEMLRYAGAVFELFQEAYQHLYGFTLLSRRQVDAYIKQYFGFVSPDFVPMVVDAQDRMVAFGITLPSLSLALQKIQRTAFPVRFYPSAESAEQE